MDLNDVYLRYLCSDEGQESDDVATDVDAEDDEDDEDEDEGDEPSDETETE